MLISTLPAVLALVGVLWGAARNRKAMIEAETARSKSTIEAENLRHQNGLDAEDRRWLWGAKSKAYFMAIEASVRLTVGAQQAVWFDRPDQTGTGPTNSEAVRVRVEQYNVAKNDLSHARSEILAVGNPDLADLANRVIAAAKRYLHISRLNFESRAAWEMHPDRLARLAAMSEVRHDLITAIRSEFGAGALHEPSEDEPLSDWSDHAEVSPTDVPQDH
ncbi:hypothetical protein [Occultella aeris]|uniref:hypothetical protein n=1 Tax=Occultella aeris TaxID=2761496 RepID=UPI0018D4D2D6|nr:hypothetical protein [Occultella aeris]